MEECEVARVLRQHLAMRAALGADMPLARLVLGIGRSYRGRSWEKARMASKQCFRNAFVLSEKTGMRYAEGYALSGALLKSGIPLPVEHAWCVDASGTAVDPTWRDPQDSFYLGVEFGMPEMRRRLSETGTWGMFAGPSHGGHDGGFMESLMPGLSPGTVDPAYLPVLPAP